MKLSKLELSGFKSFADTVTLTFEEGVTAIVGPERLREVERQRRGALGARRAVRPVAPRRQDGGRDLPGLGGPAAGQRDRGVALPRQFRRHAADRVPGGPDHAPAVALGPQRVPAQPGAGAPPRHPGSAPRHRPRRRRRRRHRSEDDRPAPLRPRRRAALPLRGGGRHRAVPRPETQHRTAPRGNRARPAARRGSRGRGAVTVAKPGPATRARGAPRQADGGEVRDPADPGADAARPPQRRRAREGSAVRRAGERRCRSAGRRWRPSRPSARRRRGTARPPRPHAPTSHGGSARCASASGRLEGDLNLATERLANAGQPPGARPRGARAHGTARAAGAARDGTSRCRSGTRRRPTTTGSRANCRVARASRTPSADPARGAARPGAADGGDAAAPGGDPAVARGGTRRARNRPRRAARPGGAGGRPARRPPAGTRGGRPSRRDSLVAEATRLLDAHRAAAADAERARHLLAETREHEALARADRRRAEESVAQLSARHEALAELERDRVGLAPGAASLPSARATGSASGVSGRSATSCAPAPTRPNSRRSCSANGCTPSWCATTPPCAPSRSGTPGPTSAPSSSSPPNGDRPGTGAAIRSSSRSGSTTPPRRAGSAPCSAVPRCSTPPGARSAGATARCCCPASARRRARSAAGPSWSRCGEDLASGARPRWPPRTAAVDTTVARLARTRDAASPPPRNRPTARARPSGWASPRATTPNGSVATALAGAAGVRHPGRPGHRAPDRLRVPPPRGRRRRRPRASSPRCGSTRRSASAAGSSPNSRRSRSPPARRGCTGRCSWRTSRPASSAPASGLRAPSRSGRRRPGSAASLAGELTQLEGDTAELETAARDVEGGVRGTAR